MGFSTTWNKTSYIQTLTSNSVLFSVGQLDWGAGGEGPFDFEQFHCEILRELHFLLTFMSRIEPTWSLL